MAQTVVDAVHPVDRAPGNALSLDICDVDAAVLDDGMVVS